MKLHHPLLGLFLALFLALDANAQVTNGTYRSLTDANSARVVALGGLPLAIHDGDLQTATFNPSAISSAMHNQLVLSYVGDFNLSTNYASAQYSCTFEKLGSFAASVQYYNYGNMPYASEGSYVDGSTFNVSDYSITLGWGRELSDKWSIGANLKYAGLQFESYHGGAIAVDVATTYWAYSNWAFTLAARNIGMQLFNDFDHAPALVLAEGAGLHHADGIADAALVVLVVRLELIRPADDLLIGLVRNVVSDGHDDGLVHLVGDDLANAHLTGSRSVLVHFLLPPHCSSCFSRITVLTRAMSRRTVEILTGLSR